MSSNGRLLTNGNDLNSLMKTCKTCSRVTGYGKNIVCHTQLPYMNNFNQKQKNNTLLICNTANQLFTVGHWFVLIIRYNKVYMCDGLGYVITRQDVMDNVTKFCRINNFHFVDLKTRCQLKNSEICGFVAIFFVGKYTTISFGKFCQILSLFRRNSIKSNELLVMKFVQKHFRFQL